jgi:hypothetical protein
VFQLRIRLEGIDPVVWRRVLVPGSVRLAKLHAMFQAAMGWTDSHLHAFQIGGQLFGMCVVDWDEDEIDEREVTVVAALRDQRRFVYDYDFGDSWSHEVVVEDFRRLPIGLKHAVCLDGENACPPEDCGGAGMYAVLCEALADPSHEEHDEYSQWLGEAFDPAAFDLAVTNAALQRVR